MSPGAVAVSSARDNSRFSRRLVVVRFWLPIMSAVCHRQMTLERIHSAAPAWVATLELLAKELF
jgi:hypothetical protein